MAKRPLPQILCDEHIKQGVREAFEAEGFKCVQIKKTEKYAGKYGGREESNYMGEIFAEENLFATADIEFVNEVIATNLKHAGILALPTHPDNEAVETVAGLLAELVRGYIKANGRNSVKRKVFYVDQDGFHIVEKGIKRLEYSLQAMAIDQGVDLDL